MELQTTYSGGGISRIPMPPASSDSDEISKAFKKIVPSLYSPGSLLEQVTQAHKKRPLEERLYDACASCKIKMSTVAMHLNPEWRSRFFSQLDSLMDFENWEKDDRPVTEVSFTTLLRMILLIRPERRPGLGSTSEGNILAAWTVEQDRLTIECLPKDEVRWVLSRCFDGKRESAAGKVSLPRLNAVLTPYNPDRWFTHDGGQEIKNTSN
ncbi:MAG: hypothetical protein ACRESZ_03295 [Methylococcales bacterium]